MAVKRFTETNKWRDPWYRALSSPAKQLWQYLYENCDAIGLIEINFKLTSDDCGQRIKPEHITELGDRVQSLGKNRFFIPKFIGFQYGELSASCPAHKHILNLVRIHGLQRDGIAYRYPSTTHNAQPVENQENAYPSPRVALPLRQDKAGKGTDNTQQGGVGGGNGAPDIELPSTFPATKEDAIAWAAGCGVSDEFVIKTWQKAYARGGRDAKEVEIKSWPHYVQVESNYERSRAKAPSYLIPNL